MPKSRRWIIAALTLAACLCASAQIQKHLPDLKSEIGKDEVTVSADSFSVDQKTSWVDAKGNVVVETAGHSLRSDRARLNRETGDVIASGNVVLKREGFGTWTGEHIEYNYKTGEGMTSAGDVKSKDFFIHADELVRREDGRFDANGLAMTTCTNEPGRWHWCIKGDGRYKDNDYVEIFDCVPYLFGVPFAYLPWAYRDLDTHYGLRIMPGYTSRWGGYLMTAYLWNIYRSRDYKFDASTHFDYRWRKGAGFGQNFHWNLQEWGVGRLETYYADDLNPHSSRQERNWLSDYKDDRYRFRLFHKADVTPRDQLLVRGTIVSDSAMRHDYFEHEDRGESIPMNYAAWEHREHSAAFGVTASGPLNNFYPGASRLPEGWLNIEPQPLLLGVNYESQTRMGYMQRDYGVFKHADEQFRYYPGQWAHYDTTRFDTAHRLTRPFKIADALSVVPRAGYRGTYYASGQSADDLYRQSAELGAEFSMRGTKEFQNGWRHILEPYIDYSYQPTDWNHAKDSGIYYFDRFDRSLGWFDQFGFDGSWLPYDWHGVRSGLRNVIQKRDENGKARTIFDIDAYTGIQFSECDGPMGEEGVRLAGAKIIASPQKDVDIKAHAEWDTEDDAVAYANLAAFYKVNDSIKFGGGYLGRNHDVTDYGLTPVGSWNRVKENLIYAGFTHAINDQWSYSPFIRWDGRENELDEVGGYVQFQLDCLVFQLRCSYVNEYTRIDGSERGDDFRVSFNMWLRAEKKSDREKWQAW